MKRQKNQRIWAFKVKKWLRFGNEEHFVLYFSPEIHRVCEVFQGMVSSGNSQISVRPEVLGTFKKLET